MTEPMHPRSHTADRQKGHRGTVPAFAAWLAYVAALAAPPLLTLACVFAAVGLDRLQLGRSWQLVVLYAIGPGALTVGLVAALGAAHLVSPGSRIVRIAIVVAEMVLVYLVWSRACMHFVTAWK